MKTKFFTGLFLFAFTLNALSQYDREQRIDSLKKILPLMQDSARVDCLNNLSEAFVKMLGESYHSLTNDSAKYYANLAFEEAKKINYVHGMAEAKSLEVDVEGDNSPKAEILAREAIALYTKTANKKRLTETYYNLGAALYFQSKFTEAVKNLDTCYHLFKKDNDPEGICMALCVTAWTYEESGNYEKAFELARKSLAVAIVNNDDRFRRYQLRLIGVLFRDIEDYSTALAYCLKALENPPQKRGKYTSGYIASLREIAELYTLQKQYDSARHYYNLFDTSTVRGLRFYLVSFGEYLLQRKEYNKALPHFIRALNYHRQTNDRNQVMRTLIDIAKTYLALENNTAALRYAKEGLTMAKQTEAKQFIRDAYKILYSVYDRWHQADSSLFYYRQYVTIKDSIVTNQAKGKLIAYNYEQKIELMDKEKQINQQQLKIQKQQLKQETLDKKILTGSIVALTLLASIGFRNIVLKRRNEAHRRELVENELQLQKLESEKKQEELQRKATELEMQALRAQMNPHFIFNCLSSINRFILKNESDSASDYLTKFSRLIRMVLAHSKDSLISLEDELEMLRLYLDLEKLRFKNSFNYSIIFNNSINSAAIEIPPLLLQPFAENAIWHGLMHKEGQGQIDIKLSTENNMLECVITDNGVGRNKAASLKAELSNKQKSMGLQITADRLNLFNSELNDENLFTIEDIVDEQGNAAGTKVILKIRIKDTADMQAEEI